MIADVARTSSKALFAAADLLLGRWPGPRILIYHQVGTNSRRQLEVSVRAFQAHLSWLRSQATIVGLEEAVQRRGLPADHNLFVITFDDGYADLYEVAYPLLKRDAVPFTLYLSTKHVETGEPMFPGGQPLTWDQIGTMAQDGLMTLGSHTHQHLDLRHSSRSQIEDDLGQCDRLITERVGISPRHFAYPWGYWSPLADTAIRRRYDTAALGAGRPVTGETDPYLLHRLPVQRSDGVLFFRRKAKRGMRLEEKTRRILRGYRGP